MSSGYSLSLNDTSLGDLGFASVGNAYSNEAVANDITLRSNVGNLILGARNSTGNILFTTGSTDSTKMTVLSAGNVGIGTTTPDSKLSVWGPTTSTFDMGNGNDMGFKITDWSDGNQYIDFNGDLKFRNGINGVGGNSPLTITEAGYLGVGDITPTYKFDVNGEGRFTSYVDASYFTATTSTATSTFAGGIDLSGHLNFSTDSKFFQNNLLFLRSEPVANGGLTIGANAGANLGASSRSVFIGYNAGNTATSSLYNTGVGYGALDALTAGATNEGDQNTALGYLALTDNTYGYFNSAVGVNSLANNTTGYLNSGVGVQSLFINTTGYYNTSMGAQSLRQNTTGFQNSAFSVNTLYANTTGENNTGSGFSALRFNTSGIQNSAFGATALYSNTTGDYNTAIGANALLELTTGATTTALGFQAGYGDGTNVNNQSTVDTNSLFLGAYSSRAATVAQATVLDNATAVGYMSQVACSDCMVLGGTGDSAVNVGIGTTIPYTRLSVFGTDTTNRRAFEIINSASTTLLAVSNNGIFTYGTSATSTIPTNKAFAWTIATTTTQSASSTLFRIDTTTGSEQVVIGSGFGTVASPGNVYIGDAGAPSNLVFEEASTIYAKNNKLLTVGNGTSDKVNFTGSIGIATSTAFAKLSIASGNGSAFNGALCADNGGLAKCYGTLTAGTVYGDASSFSASDIAENYPIADETIEAGDIVALSDTVPEQQRLESEKLMIAGDNEEINNMLKVSLIKTTTENSGAVFGIISTAPGVLLGDITGMNLETKLRPVALSGRVPVKINLEGGEIKIGDRIAPSSVPGVGRKAKAGESTVAMALENYSEVGEGKILVFVNLSWQKLATEVSDGDITSENAWSVDPDTGMIKPAVDLDFNQKSIIGIRALSGNNWSIDEEGNLRAETILAKKITAETSFEVGTQANPTGITLYDAEGGAPYCMKIVRGVPNTTAGKCEDTSAPQSTPTQTAGAGASILGPIFPEDPISEPTAPTAVDEPAPTVEEAVVSIEPAPVVEEPVVVSEPAPVVEEPVAPTPPTPEQTAPVAETTTP